MPSWKLNHTYSQEERNNEYLKTRQQLLPLRATCFLIPAQWTQNVFWGSFHGREQMFSSQKTPENTLHVLLAQIRSCTHPFITHCGECVWETVSADWPEDLRALSEWRVGLVPQPHPWDTQGPVRKSEGTSVQHFPLLCDSLQPSFHYAKQF